MSTNFSGTWYNELGSSMTIEQNGNNLSGNYYTAVGEASGTYPLVGLVNPSQDTSQTVAWTVTWQNSTGNALSTTAWCGQVQVINNVPTITAMWLLTGETTPANDWESTRIGQDVFTPQPPNSTQSKIALARKSFSHPRKL
ncbi:MULTISPECIES: avidin/streptavidin family protein [unclassified Janthinobacterium]|uniref:avidin/streptavidin family protein n=1 Tax=unclassified Janthinobacterium TaxID=2610881 RepID=UPI0016073EDA|nr:MULTISPECIES: avidin/streptavidin family protein [unclassified Janthinobacterium]MBB5609072.1 hypothetical protein [Janthinobacterium sp. S3T4]MBB5614197.1 hypothetical protein [Janthinobacterium sp. S3M3]